MDIHYATSYNGCIMNTAENPDSPIFRKFLFLSGRISLDLSHTGGKRTAQAEHFEVLHRPEDFSKWLAQSTLSLEGIMADEQELAWVYELREAIWYAAHAVAGGQPIEPSDLKIINKYAAFELPAVRLTQSAQQEWRQPITVLSLVSYIARDAIELLGTDTKHRLRECANPKCPLLFVDLSRPNKRRWCSMERCGLMEKTMRFRNKAKQM